jgi:arylsulfatase A-like enzyme
MGYGDIGCFGAKDIETPNLDRLAKQGRRFTNFYVAQAVCSASRTALLTGCYPNRIGILGALGPKATIGIDDGETTIAEVLKSCGYATAIFGKWHLGHHPRFLPTHHGFDRYFGLPYSNDMKPMDDRPNKALYPPLPLIEGDQVKQIEPDQNQLTTWYTEQAVRFIDDHHASPFFLYLPHSMPHVPLGVSDKFRGRSKQGMYGDVISEIDWSVGQVMASLDRHGVADNTLVIFTTDNGPWLNYGNHAGSSGGLREGKGTSMEGGVRVPCIMRWPGHIPADTVCDEPAMTIDILPTLAHLAGAALPQRSIDGLDITPLLLGTPGAKNPHDAYYFYWGQELQAIRSGPWKLHFPHEYRSLKEPAHDGKPGTYVQAKIGLELFDLTKDPAETTNVAADHPDVVARLQALAEKARADLGDSAQKKTGSGVREPGRVER